MKKTNPSHTTSEQKTKQIGPSFWDGTKKASEATKNVSPPAAILAKSSSATAVTTLQMPIHNKARSRTAPILPKKSPDLKERLVEQSGQSQPAISGANIATTKLIASQFASPPTSSKIATPSETNAEVNTITTSEVVDPQMTSAKLDEEFKQGLLELINRTYPRDRSLIKALEKLVENIMTNFKDDKAILDDIQQERIKSQHENRVKKNLLKKIEEETKRLNTEAEYLDKKQKELMAREEEITEKEKKLKQMQANILVVTIRNGNNKELNNLIDTQGFDPNVYDQLGRTPLHAAVIANNLEAVNILLGKNANPNLQDTLKRLPLHWAFLENEKYRLFTNINEDVVMRLLEGTNSLIRDSFNRLALDYLSVPDELNKKFHDKYKYLSQALKINMKEMELLEKDSAEEIKEEIKFFTESKESLVQEAIAKQIVLDAQAKKELLNTIKNRVSEKIKGLDPKLIPATREGFIAQLQRCEQEIEAELKIDKYSQEKTTQITVTTAPASSITNRRRSKSCTEIPVVPGMFSPTPRPSSSATAAAMIQKTRLNK